MPKYLFQVNYVGEGVKGLLKDGGSKRRAVTEKLFKSAGGQYRGVLLCLRRHRPVHHCGVPQPCCGDGLCVDRHRDRHRHRQDDGAAEAGGNRRRGETEAHVYPAGKVRGGSSFTRAE